VRPTGGRHCSGTAAAGARSERQGGQTEGSLHSVGAAKV
jgi:hypothetical protein